MRHHWYCSNQISIWISRICLIFKQPLRKVAVIRWNLTFPQVKVTIIGENDLKKPKELHECYFLVASNFRMSSRRNPFIQNMGFIPEAFSFITISIMKLVTFAINSWDENGSKYVMRFRDLRYIHHVSDMFVLLKRFESHHSKFIEKYKLYNAIIFQIFVILDQKHTKFVRFKFYQLSLLLLVLCINLQSPYRCERTSLVELTFSIP